MGSSIQSNSSQVKRMPPTTSPEVTTPLVRKSSISASTESESLPINALVSKASLPSTPSVVVPDLVLGLSSSRDFPLSTHPHRYQLPLLSHTTPSFPPTLFLSTPMLLSSSITKPFMTSAEETSILRDQPTPT